MLGALPGVISQGLIWGIMAIGLFITFKVLDFADLTVDGSIVTGACVLAKLVTSGVSVYIAILIAFIAGCIAGMITGLLNTLLKIPAILSGILTQLMLWSINLKILGQANIGVSPRVYKLLVLSSNPTQTIIVGLLFVLLISIALYWFFGTEFGCSIRATGNNETMSKAQGINTAFTKVFGLALSNGLVALSGALLAQYQASADIKMGTGAIVIGLASIIIGQAIIKLFTKNFFFLLIGCAVGSIIYYFVYQIIVILGFDTDLLKLFSAVLVTIFLAIPNLKGAIHLKKDKSKEEVKSC